MDFGEYIDLGDPDGPKLVGHRIWLYNVLFEHLFNGRRADQIVECFPTLSMEKVYACLLYFERNKAACRAMVDQELERRERNRAADAAANPGKAAELRARLAAKGQPA
jgi:uncharacterized protein (DUF433 family)